MNCVGPAVTLLLATLLAVAAIAMNLYFSTSPESILQQLTSGWVKASFPVVAILSLLLIGLGWQLPVTALQGAPFLLCANEILGRTQLMFLVNNGTELLPPVFTGV